MGAVIASAAKQSTFHLLVRFMDCFAALAMTVGSAQHSARGFGG